MKFFVLLCSVVSFGLLSSCNIASVATYIGSPDPSQDAVCVLPNVRTVVFVDDRRNVMHPTRLRRIVAEKITDDLLQNDTLVTMVSPRDILRISSTGDRYGEPIPISQLATSVDAENLIYVELTGFSLTSDGHTAKPVANCNVKVINARKRERIFPLVEESFRVQAVVTNIAPSRLVGSGEVRKLSEELAINLGDAVAKLFYSHYTGRLGEDVEKRRH
ncbi:MAG: hypothetical protein CMJ26_05075 [Phycisphaerae bacterium]|nr:hypothetical protein [Phycisphaerae bacterium]